MNLTNDEREGLRMEMNIQASADRAYGQGLWYAWGRLDAGCGIGPSLRAKLDAFEFAESVKTNQMRFDRQETHMNESIQGQWAKYMDSKFPE